MPEQKAFADLHIHASLKSFMSGLEPPANGAWNQMPLLERHRDKRSKRNNYTQSDLSSLNEANVKLAITSLVPVEGPTVSSAFMRMINYFTSQFHPQKLRYIGKSPEHSYFDELCKEYEYLKAHDEVSPNQLHRFRLVKNTSDFKKSHQGSKLLLSIEGGHSFLGQKKPKEPGFEAEVLSHVEEMKNWEHRVFFVTLCHFGYNHLSGHAYPVPIPRLLRGFFQSLEAPYEGITHLGQQVIALLHDASVGRHKKPIYLDIKHMHIQARYAYYQLLLDWGGGSFPLPIIASHMAVNGFPNKQALLDEIEDLPRDSLRAVKFNPWSINLCDDEIEMIVRSGGLIGLSLDERILGSQSQKYKGTLDELLSYDPVYNQDPDARENINLCYTELLLDNLFHMVEVLGEKKVWDHLCLGTDFDGIINPIGVCPTALDLPELRSCMEFLIPMYLENKGKERLLYGYSLDELLDKFFYTNLENFVKTYF